MGQVTRLFFVEDAGVDQDRLRCLVAELGPAGADRVIGRAMEEIAVRLTRIENAFEDGQLTRVAKGARSLIPIADQTGLSALCARAACVAELAESRDSAALAACVSRLIRVGEMSLVTIWDVHDISV